MSRQQLRLNLLSLEWLPRELMSLIFWYALPTYDWNLIKPHIRYMRHLHGKLPSPQIGHPPSYPSAKIFYSSGLPEDINDVLWVQYGEADKTKWRLLFRLRTGDFGYWDPWATSESGRHWTDTLYWAKDVNSVIVGFTDRISNKFWTDSIDRYLPPRPDDSDTFAAVARMFRDPE